ncbi:MAG: DUF4202 family protein [Patescibacteria group bacterium]
MNKITKTKNEIKEILKESPLDFEVKHAEHTLKRLLELMPDADNAVQIAALAHDIDRGVYKITETHNLKDFGNIDDFKREHAIRSAQVTKELLEKNGFDEDFIEKVTSIVKNHEVGGDQETNAVMDADSISYFDYNIYEYYEKNGPEKTKNKVRFMSTRVSPRALEVIKNIDYFNEEVKIIVQGVLTDINR